MLPWLNFTILVISSILFTLFYVKSVGPAALEKKIGESAYEKCAVYRMVASIFMMVAAVNYVLYYWFALPVPIPAAFPWSWPVSIIIAVMIAIPSLYLMLRGAKDAGEDTMRPRADHKMYDGIYNHMRHPQAVGELPLWWVIAFLVNSPFLALFSFVYVYVWYYFCIAEEKDLLIRYGAAYEEYRQKVGFWIPKRNSYKNH